jgi:ribonuclease Z
MFKVELKSLPQEDICLKINLDNHPGIYLCECGEASLLEVKDCHDTKAIFISHTHIDHFIHFDFILRHQLGLKKRVVICGPLGIAQQVQSKIRAYTWNLIEASSIIYEIREIIDECSFQQFELSPPFWELMSLGIRSDQKLYEEPGFSVDYAILDHKTPSISYLFQEYDSLSLDLSDSSYVGGPWVKSLKTAFLEKNETAWIAIDGKKHLAGELFHLLQIKKGHSIGIIMDHAANAENHAKIKALFEECDLVYIESFFKAEDQALATQHFHSYSLASAKIMQECGVKTAIPVHFSRKYKQVQVQELIAEFYDQAPKSLNTNSL